jgi:hypothetical protein
MNAKLTDNTIAQIAKCLQLALLTGTDIVDHLRQLDLVVNDGKIDIAPEFAAQFEANITKMLGEVQETQQQKKQTLFG